MAAKKKRDKKTFWLFRFVVALCTLSMRTVLFTVMFLLCVLCAGWLLFIKFFNAQYLSEEITRHLQVALNRPVIITSMDLRLFNTLELKGFSVLDSEVAHGEALVSAESVFVHFKL